MICDSCGTRLLFAGRLVERTDRQSTTPAPSRSLHPSQNDPARCRFCGGITGTGMLCASCGRNLVLADLNQHGQPREPVLPLASVLHVEGWGRSVPTSGRFQLMFVRDSAGSIEIEQEPSRTVAYRFVLEDLSLSIENTTIRSGGGFRGIGIGGVLEARALNALTSSNKHYGMLTIAVQPQGLSKRIVVLGYRDVADAGNREASGQSSSAAGRPLDPEHR